MQPFKSSRMICLDFMQLKQLSYISIGKPEGNSWTPQSNQDTISILEGYRVVDWGSFNSNPDHPFYIYIVARSFQSHIVTNCFPIVIIF